MGQTKFGAAELGARLGFAVYTGVPVFRRVFVEGETFTSSRAPFFTDPHIPGNSPIQARVGATLCFAGVISFDLVVGKGFVLDVIGNPDLQLVGAMGYSPATCQSSQNVAAERAAAASQADAEQAAAEAAAQAAADHGAALQAAADQAAAEKAAADQAAAQKAAADAAAAAAAVKAAADAAAEKAAARKDTDGDGIPDRFDNCPTEKGTADNFGCPAKTRQLVTMRAGKIEILEKVQFLAGKATIAKGSFPLLDQVAGVLKAHPELEKVEVGGHTDSVGGAGHNLRLSQGRAAAVVTYLTKQGVSAARLEAKGYGETQPLGDNKTKEGQEQNRRVEFKVTSVKAATAP